MEALNTKIDKIHTQTRSHDVAIIQSSCEECGVSHEPGCCPEGKAPDQDEVNYMGNQGRPQYPYNNQNRNQTQRFGYQPDSGRQSSQYYQQTGQQRQYYNQGAGSSSQQRGQNYQSRDRDQQQGQKETQVQPYKPIVVDSEFRPTTGAGTSQQTEVDRGNRLEKMIEQILVESQNASKLAEQRFHHS
jgi:hypothetical protein